MSEKKIVKTRGEVVGAVRRPRRGRESQEVMSIVKKYNAMKGDPREILSKWSEKQSPMY